MSYKQVALLDHQFLPVASILQMPDLQRKISSSRPRAFPTQYQRIISCRLFSLVGFVPIVSHKLSVTKRLNVLVVPQIKNQQQRSKAKSKENISTGSPPSASLFPVRSFDSDTRPICGSSSGLDELYKIPELVSKSRLKPIPF